jgi:hypothetical protein
MNMYDQTVQFEKTALSIFHEIKTYLPAKVILDYLQEKHSEYLKQQKITNAMHSDSEGCIHCDSGEDIPSAFNYCPYCNKKLRRQ